MNTEQAITASRRLADDFPVRANTDPWAGYPLGANERLRDALMRSRTDYPVWIVIWTEDGEGMHDIRPMTNTQAREAANEADVLRLIDLHVKADAVYLDLEPLPKPDWPTT